MEIIIKDCPKFKIVKRPWWKRVLWKPWQKEAYIKQAQIVEDGQVVRFGDKLIMNQRTFDYFKEAQEETRLRDVGSNRLFS